MAESDAERRRLETALSGGAAAAAGADGLRAALGADGTGPLSARLSFRSGSADLSRESRAVVARFADALLAQMKDDPTPWRLVVTGHTDAAPIRTREFPSNWALSARRAAAVAERLIASGVPSSRIYAVGRAAEDPIDPSVTREAWAKNRRIEFQIVRGER